MRTALSLLALFLIAGDDPPDRLRVEVTDAAGAPVAGAVVTLDLGYVDGKRAGPLARVETSSRGVAVLDGMPTDRAFHLTVDAGARGWATMKDLRWTLGGRVPVRLPPVRRVTGRVLELGPGGPSRPQAESRSPSGVPRTSSAAERPQRTAASPSPASGSGAAGSSCRERAIRKRRVLAPEKKELTVVLHPGRSIAGRLVDGSGHPVPGSRVQAVRPNEGWYQTDSGRAFARTDADGRFRIPGLHGDRWTLAVAEDQGYRGFLEDVVAGATDVVFPVRENHFESPFFLGGTLTVPKGRDPASYRLRAAPIGFRARPREGRPDAKGSFWINGTPPGLWRIAVFEGKRPFAEVGPVVCGETEFEIRVE